jgi:hypothetical protein
MARVVFGAFLLNLLGFLMDVTWGQGGDKPGYLGYSISLMNGFPYWLLSTLVFIGVNGAAAMYFSLLRGNIRVGRERDDYHGEVLMPQIRLLGINLILIPLLLILFVIVRALAI